MGRVIARLKAQVRVCQAFFENASLLDEMKKILTFFGNCMYLLLIAVLIMGQNILEGNPK